ncbi:MAG: alpha-D-ribose 1-methylphosphonate 5-triphosphate diphosphatase [Pseudomonadota bacterium]
MKRSSSRCRSNRAPGPFADECEKGARVIAEKSYTLTKGTVLAPDGTLQARDLSIAGAVVADEDQRALGSRDTIDCSGLTILPGIIDVHGDAFEREIEPRPGVAIGHRIALGAVDRTLIANGITTAFHGLTISWEPGQRSLDAGRRFLSALDDARPKMQADHRVQVRWETFALNAVDDVFRWLQASPKIALAFNDHTTSTVEKVRAGHHEKLDQWAKRSGLEPAEYVDLAHAVFQRAADVPKAIEQLAAAARAQAIPMLSHDERRLDERRRYRVIGASICEFPLAPEVAANAISNAEAVVLGGPNVIRGGSHTGALSAEDAIRDGLCTVLASDYYYPSLFHAAERLVARGVLPLAEAWALVSTNAAAAMGLSDRGKLAPGCRADCVLADTCGSEWRLVATIAAGRLTRLSHGPPLTTSPPLAS